MKVEWRNYETNLLDVDTTGFVIPEGYTLHGVAGDRHFPNTCHQDKPILILTKDSKYYAQCACGENLTGAYDCGNDALTAFRNLTR